MNVPEARREQMLRPLAIGEQLDAAIQIYKARWKPMVIGTAVVTAPVLLLLSLVQASAGDPNAMTEVDPETGLTTVDFGATMLVLAASVVAAIVGVIATAIATAGVFRVISGLYLGDEPTWQESLRFAVQRLGSVLWLLFLTSVFQVIGFVLCIVPFLWMYAAFSVAMPVLLVEGIRGYGAIERSVGLVKDRFWPTFGVIIIGSILTFFVQAVISSPLVALQFTEANVAVDFLFTAISNVVGTALTLPFTSALTMVIYFDLRVRKEGFDLMLLAQRMGVAQPDGGFPRPPGPATQQPWGAPAFGSAPPGGWYGPPGPYQQQPPPGGWPQQPPAGSYPPPPGGWPQQPPAGSYPPPPTGSQQPPPSQGSYPAPPGGWSQPAPPYPGPAPEQPAASPEDAPTTPAGSTSAWTEPAGKYQPPMPAGDVPTTPIEPAAASGSSAWTEPAGKYRPPDPAPEPGGPEPAADETTPDGDRD